MKYSVVLNLLHRILNNSNRMGNRSSTAAPAPQEGQQDDDGGSGLYLNKDLQGKL